MKVLRIDHHGRAGELDLEADDDGILTGLPAAVGARSIEALDITRGCTAWVDEDAIATGRPFNVTASRLTSQFGRRYHVLRGTVVLTGGTGPDGCATGLSDNQIADVRNRLRALADA